jgi:transposase InsO family protein
VPATTDSNHGWRVVPNLARHMVPTGLDQLWVADITYIWLQEEFAYLAIVLDAFSRRVVGWALATHLQASLAIDALTMALVSRKPASGTLIHHSDRGVQGGFKQSSQHRLCSLTAATRQAPLPAFSSPGSFSVGH